MGVEARSHRLTPAGEPLIRVADYPQLRAVASALRPDAEISERDALSLYERNWRHIGELGGPEKGFVRHLADCYSSGHLLV